MEPLTAVTIALVKAIAAAELRAAITRKEANP